MSRSAKIRLQRLSQLETEFELLLIECLRDCASGRYGLFGQNDHLDPAHKWWNWPEAQHVLDMALEIQSIGLEVGQANAICERFLHYRSLRNSNTPGEPELARKFLEELGTEQRN